MQFVIHTTGKGIDNITYNYLNLPETITFTGGNSIRIIYDATGAKLRKLVLAGTTTQYEQDYVGGLEYRKTGTGSRRIEAIYHEEGRFYNLNVDVSNTPSWRKEYTLRDHLGNARITFADKNGNGIVEVTSSAATNEILQENHYYPFGLNYGGGFWMNDAARDNGYQFNSIERTKDWGLEWDLAMFRGYDAAVGRWLQVDPIFKYYESGYAGFANNPILLNDYLGADTTLFGGYLLTVTITANGERYHDQSADRYGFNGTYATWQRTYGFEGWPYEQAQAYWLQVHSAAFDRNVQQRDSLEADRIALERLKSFLFWAILYNQVYAAGGMQASLPTPRIFSPVRALGGAAKGGVANSRALGLAGEQAVGLSGAKTSIQVGGRTRIPDALTRTTLTEVKNVKSLSFTRQLRDFHTYSQQNGLDFILYTRPNTTLSRPLQQAINNGSIIHRFIP
ncbi:MAG: hypothetical protein H6555_11935 [Lewinellaceae bacterium]|nr:hypothetical protein [Lewinellaceae bacterium]